MVGWHHQFNGDESEQALGDGEGQGHLTCFAPRGHKGSDTTERQNSSISLKPDDLLGLVLFFFLSLVDEITESKTVSMIQVLISLV